MSLVVYCSSFKLWLKLNWIGCSCLHSLIKLNPLSKKGAPKIMQGKLQSGRFKNEHIDEMSDDSENESIRDVLENLTNP